MSNMLDHDTFITVRNMVSYIKCDRRIASYVACSPEDVARVRRNIPKPQGRPKSLNPCSRDSGGAGEDYRILAKPGAVRGSAELAERIARLRPDAGAPDVNPSASASTGA